MNFTKHIPNTITSLNLFCGATSIFFAFQGMFNVAAILIFTAAVLDFFDGFAARALKAYSPIGKDLDSLADLVSFGVAPAVILSSLVKNELIGRSLPFTTDIAVADMNMGIYQYALVLFPFILAVFAGIRLAKFNNDTRQTENFIGLTTTATGMFVAGLAYAKHNHDWVLVPIAQNVWALEALVVFFSILLVSEVPMFSLKLKNMNFSENRNRFILLAVGIGFIIWRGFGGISLTIFAYVLFNVVQYIRSQKVE